jgi:hypothetical protein
VRRVLKLVWPPQHVEVYRAKHFTIALHITHTHTHTHKHTVLLHTMLSPSF